MTQGQGSRTTVHHTSVEGCPYSEYGQGSTLHHYQCSPWPCSVVCRGLYSYSGKGHRTTVVWPFQCSRDSPYYREGPQNYSGVALQSRVEGCPYSGKGQELQWCGAV